MGIFAGHEYKFYSKIQAIINMVHLILVKTNHFSICMRLCVSVCFVYVYVWAQYTQHILHIDMSYR